MIALVILAGVLIGLAIGTLGGGGSILTVPVLVYLMGMGAHEATTASLIIAGITSMVAAVPHGVRGNVNVRVGLTFVAAGVLGSIAGGQAAALVPSSALLGGFAVLMLVVGVLMLRNARRAGRVRAEDTQAGSPPPPGVRAAGIGDRRRLFLIVAVGVGVGLLTGFFGVGGGFALVPALVMLLGFPMPMAVGTSLLVLALNSIVALGSRIGAGISLDWGVIAAFTGIAIIASLAGARLSSRLSAQTLTRAFGILVLAIAAFMGVETVLTLA